MLADTRRLAQKLHQNLKSVIGQKAIIIALEGPLGSGKTTFVKALARAMGIKDMILSPTFTLHSEYGLMDHIDLWRIEDPQELTALGLDKMIAAKKVIAIEWAEKARGQITNLEPSRKAGSRCAGQATIVWVKFEYGQKENERRISFENIGH